MSILKTISQHRYLTSFLDRNYPIKKEQDGMTLVEVMIAILIFLIIMLGGANYFFLPQNSIVKGKNKRLAVFAAHQKMESLLALPYDQVTSALNESGTSIKTGTFVAKRKTTITYIDDPADGKGFKDNDKNKAQAKDKEKDKKKKEKDEKDDKKNDKKDDKKDDKKNDDKKDDKNDDEKENFDYKLIIVEIYDFDQQSSKIALSTKVCSFGK